MLARLNSVSYLPQSKRFVDIQALHFHYKKRILGNCPSKVSSYDSWWCLLPIADQRNLYPFLLISCSGVRSLGFAGLSGFKWALEFWLSVEASQHNLKPL